MKGPCGTPERGCPAGRGARLVSDRWIRRESVLAVSCWALVGTLVVLAYAGLDWRSGPCVNGDCIRLAGDPTDNYAQCPCGVDSCCQSWG